MTLGKGVPPLWSSVAPPQKEIRVQRGLSKIVHGVMKAQHTTFLSFNVKGLWCWWGTDHEMADVHCHKRIFYFQILPLPGFSSSGNGAPNSCRNTAINLDLSTPAHHHLSAVAPSGRPAFSLWPLLSATFQSILNTAVVISFKVSQVLSR